MKRVSLSALLLCGALASFPHAPAFAARTSTVTTVVLPASVVAMRAAQPDSAPTPDSLTYLETMGVCGNRRCDGSRPPCENESTYVSLSGYLPDNCHDIRAVQVYWPPIVSIRPFAPWVVVYVNQGACYGRPCVRERRMWDAVVALPPLPSGPYSLDVAVVTMPCPIEPLPVPTAITRSMPFEVVSCDSLPVPVNCLIGDWVHSSDGGGCDASITPGGTTSVVFAYTSSAPLSGLQGEFRMSPTNLQIMAIEPVGSASGYRFGWTRTSGGARWFLFNDGGAPLPAGKQTPRPILNVKLGLPQDVGAPAETRIYALDLLGSDPSGHAVPECAYVTGGPASGAIGHAGFATICGVGTCDANTDGRTDVRDLVMMVNCLRGGVVCPRVYDCNGDSTFTVDDVMCCAWRILQVRPCAPGGACDPDSTPPHKDSRVRVSTGSPIEKDGEVHVPIHIEGTTELGAARFAMRFPSDRWRVAGVESSDNGWLTLAGDIGGEAVVGAIRLGEPAASGRLDLTLRLQAIASDAGGELGAMSADLSAPDGVRLIAPIVAPVRALPGGASVELSANRPDPFTGETRFTLSLPADAAVDVGVFDLGGRRVASLHRGALKAGVTEFVWNGRGDSGARVGAGVYFYRAVTPQRSVSKRMVYLGGR